MKNLSNTPHIVLVTILIAATVSTAYASTIFQGNLITEGNHTVGGSTIAETDLIVDTDTLFVDSINHAVGIGTASPVAPFHIQDSIAGFPILFVLENTGSPFAGFRFTTTEGSIDFNKTAGNTFRLNISDGDSWELQLTPAGNLTISGSIFTASSCVSGCDRVFSSDYELPTIEEHAAAMWSKSYLPVVGPTPEEGQPLNLSDKTERMLNELEKAHIYIEQLNKKIKAMEQVHEKMKAIEIRIAALEVE